ncbi:hypothetical protein M569_00307, partial [Genlisea aurea]
ILLFTFFLHSRGGGASLISILRFAEPFSVSVVDYGATATGIEYDTLAIQSAIDDCSAAFKIYHTHCYVSFPAGKYLTATVYLRSGVVLNISSDATILGGTRLSDYPEMQERWYVVLAENATETGITGGGEINGQGTMFVRRFDERKNVMVSWNESGACSGDECRPRLVGFIGCRNVRIWNVNFKDPAYWCLHIVRSEQTSIQDVSISGDFNTPNNDGIDVEDSNNTIINRCRIDTGDDAICPKTYTGPVHNLTVTDCWVRSKSSAIKLGSASYHDFRGLLFDNITIVDSHRGLGFQIRDGGNVDDVTFSNINMTTRYYDESWWGRAEPIYITACSRDNSSRAKDPSSSISNINFINITAVSENGVFISGSGAGIVRNINLMNVKLALKRWTNYSGGGVVDYRPGCEGLVNRNTGGLMMEYVDGLRVEGMRMMWFLNGTEDWLRPLEFQPSKVTNLLLVNFYS